MMLQLFCELGQKGAVIASKPIYDNAHMSYLTYGYRYLGMEPSAQMKDEPLKFDVYARPLRQLFSPG